MSGGGTEDEKGQREGGRIGQWEEGRNEGGRKEQEP